MKKQLKNTVMEEIKKVEGQVSEKELDNIISGLTEHAGPSGMI